MSSLASVGRIWHVSQRDLAVAPRGTPHLDTRMQDRELERPRRESAAALEAVVIAQFPKQF